MHTFLTCNAGRCVEPSSRYLLAQSCLSLGKYTEAEDALVGPLQPAGMTNGFTNVPGGAAGLYLLGRICRLTGRVQKAIQHLCNALLQDPLLWCAYEELCMLGELCQARLLCVPYTSL